MTTKTTPSRRWPFLALGAAAFAIVMTVGPIVATRGIDAGGSTESFAGYNVGMMAARSAVGQATALAAATPVPAPAAVPAVPAVAAVPPPPAVEPAPSAAPIPVTRDDDELDVALELHGDTPADATTVEWKIAISNEGDEYLWGVYAYLEGLGPVSCDDRQLDVGESTTCWAEGTAWIGEHQAVAWATAWTVDRMVESFEVVDYLVTP